MAHSGWMELTHWIGVALAAPATATVLFASWRTVGQRRAIEPDAQETS
jgi:hypothetical protein